MKTYLALVVSLIILLSGCATQTLMKRGEFMQDALTFDQRTYGLMQTQKYKKCYNEYFKYLYNNCKPYISFEKYPGAYQDGNEKYWGCCSDALDKFKECIDYDNL